MAGESGGSAIADLWWFIGIMVVLGALWLGGGGATRYASGIPPQVVESPIASPRSSDIGDDVNYRSSVSNSLNQSAGPVSPLSYQRVRLGRGNASSADAANEEYITLSAPSSNSGPVNITGWFLTNGRGDKLALQNSRFVEQSSARIAIPTGALVFSPSGNHIQGPIILNPGDRADVITGTGKSYGDYRINTSFRVNKCLGYVEEVNEYDFVPSLSGSRCPDIEKEFALNTLPDQCYNYIRSLSSCHIPKITNKRDEGWRVDGRDDVPKTCVNFVLPYLSYESCVSRHINDPDFLSDEWRIYLKQRWEMWDRDRESITLSDQNGNVVDRITY